MSLLTGETLPRAQNLVMVEPRPGKEVSKQLLPLAELNAPEIPKRLNLAIPKIVQVCNVVYFREKIFLRNRYASIVMVAPVIILTFSHS